MTKQELEKVFGNKIALANCFSQDLFNNLSNSKIGADQWGNDNPYIYVSCNQPKRLTKTGLKRQIIELRALLLEIDKMMGGVYNGRIVYG